MNFLLNILTYEQLRCVWWLLIGILMLGWAITDGFDIGVGILLRIIGKTDEDRRIMINAIAPHWDGNQVWLITAAGAMFAAWPMVYAAVFSGFYLALMLVLMALFFRPIGFEYRAKIESNQWRNFWDWGLTIGTLIPALVIGVAFGNLLQGVPFNFVPNITSDNLPLIRNINMPFYHGGFNGNEAGGVFSGFISLISLLNWYALIAGLISVLMLVAHGGAFLQLKTTGNMKRRSENATAIASLLACALFVVAGVSLYFFIDGYQITSDINTNAPSTPAINKTVEIGRALWFTNYTSMPWLLVFPILGVLGFVIAALFSKKHGHVIAFMSTSIALLGVIFTFGVSMFPFIMPSSITPEHSLTVWDATSSHATLAIMALVAVVMTPIVLTYTLFSYYIMRGRLTAEYVRKNSSKLY